LGLHRGQPWVLHALWEQDGLTHSELARRLQVQPATITKMITRMEKAGFVQRRPDAEDHRLSRVFLTDVGYSVRSQVQQVWQQLEAEAFAGFSVAEKQVLEQSFRHIHENLRSVTHAK
jgi:DNA-binding MarR family transcriptional regulator